MNERLFFEHLKAKIEILTDAYKTAFNDLTKLNELKISAANGNEKDKLTYKLIFNRLNAAINDFKREMKRSLQDYYIIVDNGLDISQNAAIHVESKLITLHNEHSRLVKDIPEDIIKNGLDQNYHFHKNLKKLTVESILSYFETNYLLHMEGN